MNKEVMSVVNEVPAIQQIDGREVVNINGKDYKLQRAPQMMKVIHPTGSNNSNPDMKEHIGKMALVFRERTEGAQQEVLLSYKELKLLLVGTVRTGRELLPKFDPNGDNKALCYSLDGLHPADRVDDPKAAICGIMEKTSWGGERFKPECPYAEWVDRSRECNDYHMVQFLNLDTNQPFIWKLKSTALSAWNKFVNKTLVSLIQKRTILEDLDKEVPPMDTYYIHVTLEDKGMYLLPQFTLENSEESIIDAYILNAVYQNKLTEEQAKWATLDVKASEDNVANSAVDMNEGGADVGTTDAELQGAVAFE